MMTNSAMRKTHEMPSPSPKKRPQGRPGEGVGRAVIIETVKQLLREMQPAKITLSLVSRRAGVDPALIRYYFKDRSNLLLEVVNDLLGTIPHPAEEPGDPVSFIRQCIQDTHKFARSAKHMQRLMIDELADAPSETIRERHREINRAAVAAYARLADTGDASLRPFDPVFLYLAIVGIFDFYVSAEPLVRALVLPGTDLESLAGEFEAFVEDLLLNGLLPEKGEA